MSCILNVSGTETVDAEVELKQSVTSYLYLIVMVSESSLLSFSFLIRALMFQFTVPHNHEPDFNRIKDAHEKGLISLKTLSEAAREYEERSQIKVEMIPDVMNDSLLLMS